MSKKPIIAVDCDDVLSQSVTAWVDYANEQWGTNLTVEDYDEDWAKMWQVDHDEAWRRAQQIYDSHLVSEFAVFEEAKAVLQWLGERYELLITTSRVERTRDDTLTWIEKHFGTTFNGIHLAGFYDKGDKNGIHGTKAELLQSLDADYLIDDQPKHCFAAAEVGIEAILFGDYVWNRNIGALPDGVHRALDWAAVQEYFDGK